MKTLMIAALMSAVVAPPAVAQDRWATFDNGVTARQGAFICSEMNQETGEFFCMELACEAGAPLAVELSHDGSRLEDVMQAQFTVNGIDLGSHEFQQSKPNGYAQYASQTAAQDEQLRYWLRNGRSAEIAIGDDVEVMSLAGSSVALAQIFAACPAG